ncbi:TorD/DmsD family molecular chaperone [Arabiibacter massiliensis]|uniref:TorD/DmsD family molecular chaperone n=1 Tax=Arabiibacter massiliensis TaxID=1870985 RepID=UPI0009BAE72A|nr:molecular chaperone TorD family protein [Arabiibacter massiliensis]
MDTSEKIELMEDRALAYRFLSRAFAAAPDTAFLASMRAAASDDESHPLAAFFAELAQGDDERLRIDAEADYNRLFLGMSAHPVAPYESVYTSPVHLLMQEARDEVTALYREAGLEAPAGFDLPEDHVALEFDFMAKLAERTAAALAAGEADEAERLVETQAAFGRDHLAAWVPALCDDVEKRASVPLYRGLAAMARDQVLADRDIMDELEN